MDVEFIKHQFEDSHDGVITKSKFKVGVRHLQMVYMFICSLVMGMLRSSNGVAILAIADYTRSNDTYIQIHHWDKRIQGTILSSFFFGYALVMVPAEMYLKQIGDKLTLAAVLLINGGIAAAMPTIVNKGGWIAVCNAQFLMGMTQACISPVNSNLITNWLPPNERKGFGYVIQGGLLLGTIIALPIAGLFSEARLGWELIFYSQAMLTLSMAAVWALLTASTPDKHQAVGDTEKEFIKQAVSCYWKKKQHWPYRRILQSKPFWAIAAAHSAANCLFIFFLVEIPAFLHSQNLGIKTGSWQTSLAFTAMWAVHIVTSPTIDLVYRIAHVNYLFDIKYFRKFINGLGALGIVMVLIILPNLAGNWNHLGIILLSGALACLGLQFSGFLENHRDMTQNFSGTLLMMTSAVSNVAGALVPLTTGFIIAGNTADLMRWKIVFLSLATFYTACNVFYSLFASSDRQDWDSSGKQKFGYSNAVTNMELEELSHMKKMERELDEDTVL